MRLTRMNAGPSTPHWRTGSGAAPPRFSALWDGTVTQNGRSADFTSLDFFRIDDDGRIAEHWESVDWVRLYQSFGMLPDTIHDL